MEGWKFVEKFNDWSVRKYDPCECTIDGKNYHGMIKLLSESGIVMQPFSIDFEHRSIDEPRHEPVIIKKEDFDKVKLEIWDEGRGCDNSAIGISGCFEEWRYSWV